MTRALRALLVLGLFLPASAAAGPVTSVPGAQPLPEDHRPVPPAHREMMLCKATTPFRSVR